MLKKDRAPSLMGYGAPSQQAWVHPTPAPCEQIGGLGAWWVLGSTLFEGEVARVSER